MTQSPSDSGIVEVREALIRAYVQGASDVHAHWTENPGDAPRGDPEFREAAGDYADAALDPFSSAALLRAIIAALRLRDGEGE
jgi:hypothetical protein